MIFHLILDGSHLDSMLEALVFYFIIIDDPNAAHLPNAGCSLQILGVDFCGRVLAWEDRVIP